MHWWCSCSAKKLEKGLKTNSTSGIATIKFHSMGEKSYIDCYSLCLSWFLLFFFEILPQYLKSPHLNLLAWGGCTCTMSLEMRRIRTWKILFFIQMNQRLNLLNVVCCVPLAVLCLDLAKHLFCWKIPDSILSKLHGCSWVPLPFYCSSFACLSERICALPGHLWSASSWYFRLD